jgi:AAHS family 4-hydroxybenzoate transporter-like MFS transporter
MQTPAKINIADVIDDSRIGTYQIRVFALCTACLLMDGFDVQALGYAAPALTQDLHVASSALGPVFGAANFGVLFGSLLFSMLADKIGRRPVLISATAFFSILTLLTARAMSIQELLALRFIAGIGLGSIIPQTAALVGEYSPRRNRIAMMMITNTLGFNGGAMMGGFLSAWLIPMFGWRSVFYIGGITPLVIAMLMYFLLPESIQFLALRNKNPEKVANSLRRINPRAAGGGAVEYVVQEENKSGIPFVHLFREGRTAVTILLWLINFMNLLNLYFLASWIPTVVREAGYPVSSAVLVGTTLQLGGVIGTFVLARFIKGRGLVPVLVTSLAIACVSIALIGQPGLSFGILTAIVCVAGAGIIGSQPAINALSATSYPTYLRTTGVGWGLGVGRVGAIIGPVLGGEFLRRQWTAHEIFLAAAIPALISTLAMITMRWTNRQDTDANSKTAMAH